MSAMTRAYVGLGSNLGDPAMQLHRALTALAAVPGVVLQQVSSYYRSAPWGGVEQPDFLNAVAALDTTLTPEALLAALQHIEAAAGRCREQRWGPRTLDLDLLLHGEAVADTARLQLPHPHMHTRAFVLAPLAELAPELHLPGHGTVSELLMRIEDQPVERLPDTFKRIPS